MKKKVGVVLLVLLVAGTILINGCSREARVVKVGDTVRVEYTGTLVDGSQFDSNVGKDPLEFTTGSGQMISGFDKAVIGMKVGETKTVAIAAADSYGESEEELILDISRNNLPPDINPQVGDRLQMQSGGQTFLVTVIAVSGDSIKIDANHELAGKDLNFKIKLLDIK